MNDKNIRFLPPPQSIKVLGGEKYRLLDGKTILLSGIDSQRLYFSACRIQAAIEEHAGREWQISAGAGLADEVVGLSLWVDPSAVRAAQGYVLRVTPAGITISGHDPAGVFYGVCTLVQIVAQCGAELPVMQIEDWPDFPARGVMLDISRDRVYRMEALYELVEMLASWKINQLQLYTEHTFAYSHHREVWEHASPLTAGEILDLDRFCQERYVELVPNQNSFGHMARWLVLPRYASLAETHAEFFAPWGKMQGPFSLSPVDSGSLELVSGLFDELLPNFTSRMVNVGCDETVDLGQGRSEELCKKVGIGKVYLDYLLAVHRDIVRRGRRMQYWGDIISHHPELIPDLPRDAIALDWGYEA